MVLPLNNTERTKTISATNPVTCLAVTDSYIVAGSKSGTVISWNIQTTLFEFDLKGHTSQVNYLLADRETLYSASDDKTIFSWSLTEKVEIKILQRLSATALGHLGPVNSLSLCKNVLFSAGSDNTVRRWNTRSGRHEDVYMGASKPVTSVLCFNGSVFAGSEDFSVLLYDPGFLGENAVTSTTTMKSPNDRVKKRTKSVVRGFSEGSSLSLPSNAIVGGAVAIGFLIIATIGIYSFRKSKDMAVVSKAQMDSSTNTNITTDLKTVVNSIMGISKHAAFLLESSLIAKSTRIAAGGGGELFLAKIMNSVLAQKAGNVVVQKVVFIASKASEDAFYQEVGIMIMLSSFPHFCQIIGYTENPLSIVMKYYPDGSLFQWLRKNNYGTVLMARALKQIASAVQTMHSHYLAHCDLKTQNILVEANNGIISCYLTDFGITQVLSSYIVASKMLNIINLRGLSVHYASPESFVSFRSKDYSKVDYQKYDIYSLACTMFEIFTKKSPWS
jgi:tRNA A-37 threonylcarbamoyl transferase component Bud32